jgi:hypothetical protein
MSDKVINILVKRGHSKDVAASAVAANLAWAIKAYPEAKAAFLADVCVAA